MPIVLKSGCFNLLEPSRPVQDCNGIALPLPIYIYIYIYIERERERERERDPKWIQKSYILSSGSSPVSPTKLRGRKSLFSIMDEILMVLNMKTGNGKVRRIEN